VTKYSVKSVLRVLIYLVTASTFKKSLIYTDLALNIPISLLMMIIIIQLLNFRSTQNWRPVDKRIKHTHQGFL
jgi:hypothetical protein